MQVCVVRTVAVGVVVVFDIYDVGVPTSVLQQVQLSILVPCVLVNAFDCHCFLGHEVGASVDQPKSSMCDDFV